MNDYRSNEQIVGRSDLNDIESILVPAAEESEHLVDQGGQTRYTWNYVPGARAAHPALREGEDLAMERVAGS